MKLTFLGSGSAFVASPDNYQSNMLLESDSQETLLIDCGSDARRALYALGKTHRDVDSVFVSHLHSDHVGGLEWLGAKSYFEKNPRKPALYVSHLMTSDLWEKTLSGGLSTLQAEQATLSTYFNVHSVGKENCFEWAGVEMRLIQTIHFYSDHVLMPTFGLLFRLNDSTVYITADTQFCPEKLEPVYELADVIFHDCETSSHISHVHARYAELKQLPATIKQKMWLYHHNGGDLPNAEKDGFRGFVKRGQEFG